VGVNVFILTINCMDCLINLIKLPFGHNTTSELAERRWGHVTGKSPLLKDESMDLGLVFLKKMVSST
jgi:hypothetical protein